MANTKKKSVSKKASSKKSNEFNIDTWASEFKARRNRCKTCALEGPAESIAKVAKMKAECTSDVSWAALHAKMVEIYDYPFAFTGMMGHVRRCLKADYEKWSNH